MWPPLDTQVEGGDRLRILTPGGGGYGPPQALPDGEGSGEGEEAAALAAAVSSRARRRTGGEEFSAPVRDGGSMQQYTRTQETV